MYIQLWKWKESLSVSQRKMTQKMYLAFEASDNSTLKQRSDTTATASCFFLWAQRLPQTNPHKELIGSK